MLGKEEVLHRFFFRWFKFRFEYERFDGTRTEPIDQYVLDRGQSVGVVLHDLGNDEIVLVEQMRIAAIDSGNPWLLELPAGRVDDAEEPLAAASRESQEETGVSPSDVRLICKFYASPGTCSELLHLYYCPFPNGFDAGERGGLVDEHEDIRVHRVTVTEAAAMIESGSIVDAKSIIGVQWLVAQANRSTDG